MLLKIDGRSWCPIDGHDFIVQFIDKESMDVDQIARNVYDLLSLLWSHVKPTINNMIGEIESARNYLFYCNDDDQVEDRLGK